MRSIRSDVETCEEEPLYETCDGWKKTHCASKKQKEVERGSTHVCFIFHFFSEKDLIGFEYVVRMAM